MPVLDEFHAMFPHLPPTVMLKVDLLRQGVQFGAAPIGTRHYHHHDEKGQKPVDFKAHLQGSVTLPDGSPVFVGHNPASRYTILVDPESGRLRLVDGAAHEPVCDLMPGPRFTWTGGRTSTQAPMASVFTPSLGGACGPVAIFLLRHCEFAVDHEECRFCSWVRMGKSQEMRPNVSDMRETLGRIWGEQGAIGYLAFSGGSLFNRTKEADAFLTYMAAVRETGLPVPPTVAAIQALDAPDSRRLRDAGFDYACYSMEVWDEKAWTDVLPGKARSVGRERWMACLAEAVGVFGPGRVLSNFVAGVETMVPGLYETPQAAAESTLAGMRWCCEQGVYPKYAIWVPSTGAAYAGRPPAPLEYYAHLLEGRQALYAEFPLPVPDIDCRHCLTQSCEADLATLDPARYAAGAAGLVHWNERHQRAHIAA
ncbi:MAG: hypothetical protein HOP14_06990 [Acidobacteria bacterium]|nr:hypothetical protein [Acidobacteriota bacterium]